MRFVRLLCEFPCQVLLMLKWLRLLASFQYLSCGVQLLNHELLFFWVGVDVLTLGLLQNFAQLALPLEWDINAFWWLLFWRDWGQQLLFFVFGRDATWLGVHRFFWCHVVLGGVAKHALSGFFVRESQIDAVDVLWGDEWRRLGKLLLYYRVGARTQPSTRDVIVMLCHLVDSD